MSIELIDTHVHLQSPDFDGDRAEVIARAHAAGVTRMIVVGSGGEGWKYAEDAVALAKNTEQVWASVGVHPCSADTPLDADKLRNLGSESCVVALGETGLDFYWSTDNVAAQENWFQAHIDVAVELKKPLIIHSRNSGAECLAQIKNSRAKEVGGVFHCFAETADVAAELATLNFMVSFPGIVTFKNADGMRAVVKAVPLEQLMLETDAPYLAPVPYRGKRCESAFMVETAKVIAQIKGLTLEELARITNENAQRLFRLS
jgi:TatD DNase family protein